jgi:hypothetical protein
MDGQTDPGDRFDWGYVAETTLDVGGSVTFARGASPEQIMRAFGMNPANARLAPEPWSEILKVLPHPDWQETYPPEHPWIRVGVVGDWGFAIDESAAGYGGYEEEAATELSAGTDAVLFMHNQALDDFYYYVDGTLVTHFEPLGAWDRFGTDPDRFLPQMRQVGLRVDPPDPGAGDFRNPQLALLEMLTLAFGIRLPREVASGPLLTVQRD